MRIRKIQQHRRGKVNSFMGAHGLGLVPRRNPVLLIRTGTAAVPLFRRQPPAALRGNVSNSVQFEKNRWVNIVMIRLCTPIEVGCLSGGSYESVHDSLHRSGGCLDVWLDYFSCDERVDSYSSCPGRGVAYFALCPRETRGSGPAHQELIYQ